MKITFFSLKDDCAKFRLSTIMASLFLIVFGIQGLLNLLNPNLIKINNLELYSIFFIVLGFVLLLLSCLKKVNDEFEYYSLYPNSGYNIIN